MRVATVTVGQNKAEMADIDEGERTESLPSHILKLPTEDWELNVFLDDLASNIKDEELERLKNFVSGDGGLGFGILEKIDTPLELFTILKKRMIVSRDNLTTLQSMLWHLKNKELHRKAVEYARNIGNALYFYAPSEEPANGYKYVKVHVEGRDFSKTRRSDLEKFRFNLSKLLMVPAQFVIVSGLEPSSSFTITLMMPEYCVSLLVEILSGTNIPELVELGIDMVYIDDKKYSLSCTERIEVVQSQDEYIQAKTYERLQFAEQQLEQRDIECLDYIRKLEAMRTELKEAHLNRQNIQELMTALYQLHVFQKSTLEHTNGSVSSLKIQSALVNFRFSLKKVKDLNYDRDVIMNLIEANSFLVENRVREGFISIVKHLMTDIQKLKTNIANQQYIIQLLQFVSKSTPEEALMLFMSQLWNAFQQLVPQAAITEVTVQGVTYVPAPATLQLLRKYSHLLTKRDKQKLKKLHTWSRQENTVVEKNPAIFLEIMGLKECHRLGMPVNLSIYLPPVLADIGRKDLAKKFQEESKTLESEQARLNREASAQKVPTQGVPSNEQQQNQQLNEMHAKLMNIEKMVTELKALKDERINLLQDPMNAFNMPIFGSKLWTTLKEQRKSEHAQPFTDGL